MPRLAVQVWRLRLPFLMLLLWLLQPASPAVLPWRVAELALPAGLLPLVVVLVLLAPLLLLLLLLLLQFLVPLLRLLLLVWGPASEQMRETQPRQPLTYL
jgi:hypothetical protein